MHGHAAIIEARMNRKAPHFVFLNDYPCKTDWFEQSAQATVCTHGDSITGLDLRFLVGLRVSISATEESRAKALFERAKLAGAAVVAAVHMQLDSHATQQSGWCEVFTKEAANG